MPDRCHTGQRTFSHNFGGFTRFGSDFGRSENQFGWFQGAKTGSKIVQINLERCVLDWIFMEIPNPGSNGRLEVCSVVVRYDHIRALNTPTQTPTYHLQFTFFENSVSATCKFMPWVVHKHPQNKKNENSHVFCTDRTFLVRCEKVGSTISDRHRIAMQQSDFSSTLLLSLLRMFALLYIYATWAI